MLTDMDTHALLFYVFLGIGGFLITLLGTRSLIITLRKKQILLDFPNARSNHKEPVPRGGGIAVVFSIVIFLLLADASYIAVLSMLLLASISLVDDWVKLSPLTRLVVQLFAVLLALPEIKLSVTGGLLPPMVDMVLVAGIWLWFINLFNFMDGIDGISAAEMISIAAGLLVVTSLTGTFGGRLSLESLIILSAGAGFLWWNWHPAKIFLGDVGSIPIGFLLGYVLLRAAQAGYVFPAMILPAYYVADATLTLLIRLKNGERIWEAHSDHFYQQAVRAGKSHDMVVKHIFGINLLLILLATLAALSPDLGWMYLAVAYGMVGAVLLFFFRSASAERG